MYIRMYIPGCTSVFYVCTYVCIYVSHAYIYKSDIIYVYYIPMYIHILKYVYVFLCVPGYMVHTMSHADPLGIIPGNCDMVYLVMAVSFHRLS